MADINTLLQTTPENLAKQQHDALLALVRERLQRIDQLLAGGNYKTVMNMLERSYAGDEMGNDNWYIKFPELDFIAGRDGGDLGTAVERLTELSEMIK